MRGRTTTMPSGTAALGALLLVALPAAAQQEPQHQWATGVITAQAGSPPATQPVPAPGAASPGGGPPAGGPPGAGAPGPGPGFGGPMGGRGMMMGPGGMMGGGPPGGMPGVGTMAGEGRPMPEMMPGMRAMRRRSFAAGTPMNVIINVGPGIRVDVEDEDDHDGRPGRMMGPRGAGMMGGHAMGPGMAMRGFGPGARLHNMLAERVEGGLAFLRTELRIRPEQSGAWDSFATRIREAAARYRQARAQAPGPAPDAGLEQRLAAIEARLSAELERVRGCREAALALLPALDDSQRRTIEQLAWLVMPGPVAVGTTGAR